MYGYHTYAVIVDHNAKDGVTVDSIAEIEADEDNYGTILTLKKNNGWK